MRCQYSVRIKLSPMVTLFTWQALLSGMICILISDTGTMLTCNVISGGGVEGSLIVIPCFLYYYFGLLEGDYIDLQIHTGRMKMFHKIILHVEFYCIIHNTTEIRYTINTTKVQYSLSCNTIE